MPPKKKLTKDEEQQKIKPKSTPKKKSTSTPKSTLKTSPKKKSSPKSSPKKSPKKKSSPKSKSTPKSKNEKELKLKKENDDNILEENSDNKNFESDVIEMDNTTFQSDYREIIDTYNPLNNKTSSIVTIYEAALIVGKRATQITYGADPVIDYNETDTPESIAIRELVTKKIPYIIKRQMNNVIEYWKIDDIELNEEAISIYG